MYPQQRCTDWDRVVAGGADAAILPVGDTEMPPGLYRESLFLDPLVCVVRARHPGVGRTLTLGTYLELSHLKISPSGTSGPSTLDKVLLQLGLQRRIGLTVAFFNVAPLIVSEGDLVATLPGTLARLHADALGLRVLEHRWSCQQSSTACSGMNAAIGCRSNAGFARGSPESRRSSAP